MKGGWLFSVFSGTKKPKICQAKKSEITGSFARYKTNSDWLVVEPTHLKKMLVKLDHFPKFRDENKKCLPGIRQILLMAKILHQLIGSLSARGERAPAKDPAPSHTSIQAYIQAYIQTYIQTYIQAYTHPAHQHSHKHLHIHTYKYTYKHTYKTKQTHYNNAPPKQHPKQHPKKQNKKKYITLYNSKYCIRVVLRKNFNDIFCSIVPLHLSCLPVRRFQEKHSSAPLL